MSPSPTILPGPRPWAFSRAELTAGLRYHLGDPQLVIASIDERSFMPSRPAVGRIRGLRVTCESIAGESQYDLVVKEPHNSTRAGTIGAGRKEVAFYTYLGDQIPLRIPRMWASNTGGEWLVLESLASEREPDQWTAGDYRLAAEKLAAMHDRFWGLGEDLSSFKWLGRSLEVESYIYIKAAAEALGQISTIPPISIFKQDPELITTLQTLVNQADQILAALCKIPSTLIHGDYWPGNLCICSDQELGAYDWQGAEIGPGILDLLHLVQSSLWWFHDIPLEPSEIIDYYRSKISELNGTVWEDEDWNFYWDHALMWSFLKNWSTLVAEIPDPVLNVRYTQIDELWLAPLKLAIQRHLKE
jgi:hypothetical protein